MKPRKRGVVLKKKSVQLNIRYMVTLALIVAALFAGSLISIALVRNAETKRIEAEGQMRLSNITVRVDKSLYSSECLLDSVVMQIERMIAEEGDVSGLLEDYFCSETIEDIKQRSGGNCFSAYAAYNGELYINDFIPDEDFVLDERAWYIGAKKSMGAVSVTKPYIDASTGKMCYSISKMLSDGSTIVGIDFTLDEVQQYIEEMNSQALGTSFIVDANGMMVGHSQPEFVGRDYRELDFYYELVNKVFMLYGDSFDFKADDAEYNVFSDKTNYGWYLVVCVPYGAENSLLRGNTLYIAVFMCLVAAVIVIFYIHICREKARVESILSAKDEHLGRMSYALKRQISKISNRADILSSSGREDRDAGEEISDSAKTMEHLLDNFLAESENYRSEEARQDIKDIRKGSVNHAIWTVLVTGVLLVTGIFALISNTVTHTKLGRIRMEQATDIYLEQVKEWALKNNTVLDVVSESIAAQPGFTEDYAAGIAYLDRIISQYDDISVAYICNPDWEHTVFMNNGWEPEDDWHVEERQWYIDTMASKDNFNVSAPYLDEQTGLYCTTLSKIVYDEKGNFIGVLGIDFYLDKLIGILGESYTDTGYAFLTDVEGNILNHPNEEYQMKPDCTVNAADICYRRALSEIGSSYVLFTDYDGVKKACYAMQEDISGFNVFVVRGMMDVVGSAIYSDLLYVVVFALCLIVINVIMNRLTMWQIRANRELQEAADKAISADKAKNDFLANMSHEIRTPINAVLGMNEMIMREAEEKNILEYAANIQSSGRTLLSIINDILDFSKIESGKMEIVPVSYDVSSLVYDIINMIRIRADKKKLEFIYEIDENIPSVLYGDDVRIRQVLTNILTNAVKYTPEGYVKMQIKFLEIFDSVVQLEFSVTDTGIGIREEDMDKLFASFQRLDQEKNRSIEGTGLGMSIVQRLLTMMDSELKVSSVYGSGSTFSFRLKQKIVKEEPIGDFEERFRTTVKEHASVGVARIAPKVRVLVVDDNETNLLVAKSLLKRTRVKLDTATGGVKCIELLKNNSYHIVFLDHMMPEMDGIETLKKIKEENLAPDTCFVALTANAIHGARQSYLDAGFDDYLSKPFTGMDIERCLFEHVPAELCEEEEQRPEEKAKTSAQTDSETEPEMLFSPEAGAKYTDGDMEAYIEILELYVRKASERAQYIERLFLEKDWKNYVIEVHALKSSSLSIGSKQLSELAKELELSGKAGNYAVIEEKNSALLALYRRVAELGRGYLEKQNIQREEEEPEPLDSQPAEIPAEQAKEHLKAVCEACLAYDSDEVEKLCGMLSGYSVNGQRLKTVADEIQALAEDFEYEAAADVAEKYTEKLL